MCVNSNTSSSDKVMHEEHKATQHIPTIVNDELFGTVNNKVELFDASNEESTRDFMSDLIKEFANKI